MSEQADEKGSSISMVKESNFNRSCKGVNDKNSRSLSSEKQMKINMEECSFDYKDCNGNLVEKSAGVASSYGLKNEIINVSVKQEDEYWVILPQILIIENRTVSLCRCLRGMHYTASEVASHLGIAGKAVVGYKILTDTKRLLNLKEDASLPNTREMNGISGQMLTQEAYEFEQFDRMTSNRHAYKKNLEANRKNDFAQRIRKQHEVFNTGKQGGMMQNHHNQGAEAQRNPNESGRMEITFDKAFEQEIKYLHAELDFDLSMCRTRETDLEQIENIDYYQQYYQENEYQQNEHISDNLQYCRYVTVLVLDRKLSNIYMYSMNDITVEEYLLQYPADHLVDYSNDVTVEEYLSQHQAEYHKNITVEEYLLQYPADHLVDYSNDVTVEEYLSQHQAEYHKDVTVEEYLLQYPADHLVDYSYDITVEEYIKQRLDEYHKDITIEEYLKQKQKEYHDITVEEYLQQYPPDYLVDYSKDITVEEYLERQQKEYHKDITVDEYLLQYPPDYLVDYSNDITVEKYLKQSLDEYHKNITVEEFLQQYPPDYLVDYSKDITVEEYLKKRQKEYHRDITVDEYLQQYPSDYLVDYSNDIPVEEYLKQKEEEHSEDVTVEEYLLQYPSDYLVDYSNDITIEEYLEQRQREYHKDITVEEYLLQYPLDFLVDYSKDITVEEYLKQRHEEYHDITVEEYLQQYPPDYLVDYSKDITVEEYLKQRENECSKDITIEEYLQQHPPDYLVDYSKYVTVEEYLKQHSDNNNILLDVYTNIRKEELRLEYLQEEDIISSSSSENLRPSKPTDYIEDMHFEKQAILDNLAFEGFGNEVNLTEDNQEDLVAKEQVKNHVREAVYEDIIDENILERVESTFDESIFFDDDNTDDIEDDNIGNIKDDNIDDVKDDNIGNMKEDNIDDINDNIENINDDNIDNIKEDNIDDMKDDNIDDIKDDNIGNKEDNIANIEVDVRGNLWLILPIVRAIQQNAVSVLYQNGHNSYRISHNEDGPIVGDEDKKRVSELQTSQDVTKSSESVFNKIATGSEFAALDYDKERLKKIRLLVVSVLYCEVSAVSKISVEPEVTLKVAEDEERCLNVEIKAMESEEGSEEVQEAISVDSSVVLSDVADSVPTIDHSVPKTIGKQTDIEVHFSELSLNVKIENGESMKGSEEVQKDISVDTIVVPSDIADSVPTIHNSVPKTTEKQTDTELHLSHVTVDEEIILNVEIEDGEPMKGSEDFQEDISVDTSVVPSDIAESVPKIDHSIPKIIEKQAETEVHLSQVTVDEDVILNVNRIEDMESVEISEENQTEISVDASVVVSDVAESVPKIDHSVPKIIEKQPDAEVHLSHVLIEEKRAHSHHKSLQPKPLSSGLGLKKGLMYRSREKLHKSLAVENSDLHSASNFEEVHCKYTKAIKIPESLRRRVSGGLPNEESGDTESSTALENDKKLHKKEILSSFQLSPLKFQLAGKSDMGNME